MTVAARQACKRRIEDTQEGEEKWGRSCFLYFFGS